MEQTELYSYRSLNPEKMHTDAHYLGWGEEGTLNQTNEQPHYKQPTNDQPIPKTQPHKTDTSALE